MGQSVVTGRPVSSFAAFALSASPTVVTCSVGGPIAVICKDEESRAMISGCGPLLPGQCFFSTVVLVVFWDLFWFVLLAFICSAKKSNSCAT